MYGDTDIFRIKDLVHSVSENQWRAKYWLAETFHSLYGHTAGKILVIGGWYGLAAYQLRQKFPDQSMNIISMDMDPKCEDLGYKLFFDQNIKFETWDARKPVVDYSQYSAIISTSCEHIDPDDLAEIILQKSPDCWVALQSNNFFDHPSHINCSNTLREFEASIAEHLSHKWIAFSGYMNFENFKRFMVIGK